MTRTSLQDPRFAFDRVQPEELPRLKIELSILSPMHRTYDPLGEFKVGTHGVYIKQGERGGCFLPQVAVEQGWTAEQTLAHCCAGKAMLPPDAWRRDECEVYLFTAEIYSEEGAAGLRG